MCRTINIAVVFLCSKAAASSKSRVNSSPPSPTPQVLDAARQLRGTSRSITAVPPTPLPPPPPPPFFSRSNGFFSRPNPVSSNNGNGTRFGHSTSTATLDTDTTASAGGENGNGNGNGGSNSNGNGNGNGNGSAPYKPAIMEVFNCVIWARIIIRWVIKALRIKTVHPRSSPVLFALYRPIYFSLVLSKISRQYC